jgi:hypothetical protein
MPYYGNSTTGGVQLRWNYIDTLLLTDYNGNPVTGYSSWDDI